MLANLWIVPQYKIIIWKIFDELFKFLRNLVKSSKYRQILSNFFENLENFAIFYQKMTNNFFTVVQNDEENDISLQFLLKN